jgi:ADP-ribose pyrophosphatase YjhB (NUDIX family)
LPDELKESSVEKKLKELGTPCPWIRGMCIHAGKLLTEYLTGFSEMERIYSLPGTPMKWGERARDSLKKAFDEKYSMEISVGRFIIVIENKFPVFRDRLHLVELVFEVKIQSAEFVVKVPDINLKWLDMNELDRYNFNPTELKDALFAQNIHRLKHIISGDLKFVK